VSDTTVVSLTAIVVAGILGPSLAGWIQLRLASRRERHERELHDIDELRALLDDALASLFDIERGMADLRATMLRHGHHGYRRDRGPYAAAFEDLWENLRNFRQRAARLAIRVGPATKLARTTEAATDHTVEIIEIVDQSLFMEDIKPEEVQKVLDRGEILDGYRKLYVELGHEAQLGVTVA
jgi:hypothetical protein